jgi:hypothetical protein
MSLKLVLLFVAVVAVFFPQVSGVFWINLQNTTVTTDSTPVLVQFQRYLLHNQPASGVTGVFCSAGSDVCYVNTTQAPPYSYGISISSAESPANITVFGAPAGSQPQISVRTGSSGGTVLQTWDLSSGVNGNLDLIISSQTFPVGTLLSMWVNGGAGTTFQFSPYVSATNFGMLWTVAHP